MNKTVEMYNDGYELDEIMDEMNLNDVNEVLEEINKFKEESKIARGTKSFTFTTEFKQLLVNRYQAGFSLYSIFKEFDLSSSTVSKYLQQAGIDTTKQDNKRYEVIDWNDFESCPDCKSHRHVRNVGLHNQDEAKGQTPTHSFCTSCNTEWYAEALRDKVKGKFQIVGYETRKVLWHSVN